MHYGPALSTEDSASSIEAYRSIHNMLATVGYYGQARAVAVKVQSARVPKPALVSASPVLALLGSCSPQTR